MANLQIFLTLTLHDCQYAPIRESGGIKYFRMRQEEACLQLAGSMILNFILLSVILAKLLTLNVFQGNTDDRCLLDKMCRIVFGKSLETKLISLKRKLNYCLMNTRLSLSAHIRKT